MKIVRDTQFCVTDWSALDRAVWPNMVACASLSGPTTWSWPKRTTPLSIKCLLKSEETYELKDRAIKVDSDSFLILNEGTEYASHIDSSGSVETATVFLTEQAIGEVLSNTELPHSKLLDADTLTKSTRFIERLYPRDDHLVSILTNIHQSANSKVDDLKIQQQLYALIEHLLLIQNKVTSEIESLSYAKFSTREEIYKRVHICRDYMISNPANSHNLDHVAAIAGFSPYHFLRSFKEVFGQTPHKYLTNLRLQKARKLIQKTNLPISAICLEVGFESLPSFSNLYKRSYGISPAKERSS